jgi:hypothetical protein
MATPLLPLLLMGVASTASRWYRCPGGMIWRRCPNLHNTGAGTAAACEALCAATKGCTAINYSPVSCALRACPNGTEPGWQHRGYVGWASYPLTCRVPPPPPPPPPPSPQPLVSATLGSHMVLQRAPASARVWGSAPPGTAVSVSLDGERLPTVAADKNGTWRQSLPPTAASSTRTHLLEVTDGVRRTTLSDILFGDVFLCGGQSNMVFAMPAIENATAEIAAASRYPAIRLFTVGEGTGGRTGVAHAQADLSTVLQPWSRASNVSVASGGRFGIFSAVCWIFGRTIFEGLGGSVPVGLVASAWGGTRIESWSPDAVFEACPAAKRGPLSNQGPHWNAMIAPFAHGETSPRTMDNNAPFN